jgi:hypothetical protein
LRQLLYGNGPLAALLFLGHTLTLKATSQTFGSLLTPYIVKNQPNELTWSVQKVVI